MAAAEPARAVLERHGARWPESVPPVTVTVACGGQPHRVTWRSGALVLADHDDTVAELVIRALGAGQPMPACIALLEAWRRDPVESAQRPPAAPPSHAGIVAATAELGAVLAGGPISPLPDGRSLPEALRRRRDLSNLITGDRGRERAVSDSGGGFEQFLDAAVRQRLRPLVEPATNHLLWRLRASADVQLDIGMSATGDLDVSGEAGPAGLRAVVRVPLRWLLEVWPDAAPADPASESFVVDRGRLARWVAAEPDRPTGRQILVVE